MRATANFLIQFTICLLTVRSKLTPHYADGNYEIPTLSRDSVENRGKTSGQVFGHVLGPFPDWKDFN